jgi:hypothetical protein
MESYEKYQRYLAAHLGARKELWSKVYAASISVAPLGVDAASFRADAALKAFDSRFPIPKPPQGSEG